MNSVLSSVGKFGVCGHDVHKVYLRAICERIVKSYRKQMVNAPNLDQSNGKWSNDGWETGLSDWSHALASGNVERCMEIANKFFQTRCSYGIAMGAEELRQIVSSSELIKLYERQWREDLLRLARAVGCALIPNPEVIEVLISEPSLLDILSVIQRAIGYEISFPQALGVFGCEIRSGEIFPKIAFGHILAEQYCRSLIPLSARVQIVELGGGVGFLPFFISRKASVSYVGFDTAAAIAFQAVFLSIACPEMPIRLYGEPNLEPFRSCSFSLLPSWMISSKQVDDALKGDIDLLINQDTLLELSPFTVKNLVGPLIMRLKGPLLSISPDYSVSGSTWRRNSLCPELVSMGLRLVDRVPFFLKDGYTREIYCR